MDSAGHKKEPGDWNVSTVQYFSGFLFKTSSFIHMYTMYYSKSHKHAYMCWTYHVAPCKDISPNSDLDSCLSNNYNLLIVEGLKYI